jgi:hypothetical protein
MKSLNSDEVEAELHQIINDSSNIVRNKWQTVNKDTLIMKLKSYIKRRDQVMHNKGFKKGEQSAIEAQAFDTNTNVGIKAKSSTT